MDSSVRFHPHCFGVFDGFYKFHSFFERKVETGGGNRIRNSGIRSKDGNRGKGIFREKSFRVDDMVIFGIADVIITLVRTACYKSKVAETYSKKKTLVGGEIRILNSGNPVASVAFCSDCAIDIPYPYTGEN